MAKENHKKVLAMLLAASIAVPTPVLAVSPSDFKDFPDNWAKAALSYSVSNGLLSGSDGMIRPNDSLTRAEMAAIINRLAGAKETTSLTNYADVSPSAWYYQDMGKAVQMGTFVGDGGNLRPEAAITRQEVFSVLARYYCLESANTDVLKKYADMQQIGSWALESTAAMVEAGYIHGDGEKLNPVAPITRAEFAQVIRNVAGTIVDANSSVSETVSGNLVVRGDNVVLKGTTIEGDLILADGADHTTLDGVTVKGRIVIRGGAKGVEIKNSKSDKGVIVSNPNKDVVISASDSQLGTVILRSDVDLSGEYEKIVVEKQLDVSLDEGKVSKLVVEKTAKSASVQVAENGVVNDIVVNAPDVNIAGEGAVSQVFANGNGIQISTKNTKVTTGNNVSGVIAGGKEISANSSVTTEASTGDKTSSGGSSSSSGGSGGSSQKHDVYLASSWKELRQAVSKAKAGDIVRLSGNITDAGADTDVVLDGVSSATLPLNQKNLIFDGNGHTISAAEGKTFCFDVDGKGGEATGLEIRSLTVDGASFSAKLGGAFFVEDGTSVTFRNVTIKNSKANSGSDITGGGAIFINDHGNPPQVQIIDCVFENNTVPNAENNGFVGRGGAIYANNFRSTSAVKLTVKDSVFRNNQAAYGGAIAADGVVDLVVENCTFEENSGTVGADDIYIYDGISTGKKNLTIASTVTATLLGNTYTNTSSDSDDMTAMNVIFGRYYPADFSGKPGVAPVGAIDLTFKDIQRTQVQDEVESIAMTKVELQGKDYYYGVPVNIGGTFVTKFTVDGSEVAAEKIGDTNVYYYAAEQPTGTYYGTAEVPFADFYYGELKSVSKPEQTSVVTKIDAAEELRGEGEYDAVTSATTRKWNRYSTTYVQTNEDGTGSILGLKTPVAVEASVYVQGMLLHEAGVSSQNELISILASMTDITTEPTQQYKTIYANGTLSAMESQSASALTPSDTVAAIISDQTSWGNYLIKVEGLPEEIKVTENLLGVILTDQEGKKYGLKQVDNLFLKSAGEMSFAVEEFTEPHGNAVQYQRFAELPGKTITSITYLTKGYQNFTIENLNLYCGKQLADEQLPVVVEKTAFEHEKGATVTLDTSKLPYADVELVSVKMGSGKKAVLLEKDKDYTYNNNILQILDTEKTEKGLYTITFADTNKESGYVSSSISVNLEDEISEPVGLSDGEWYGTGTYSLYYETKGPDVVRVNIKDGKIAGADPVKHIEDGGFERGQDILNYVKNISTVEEINALEEQLANQKGAAYDAVSGATETAKGHLSAVKNAIQRSEKYTGDGVEQNVQWFDFATRPKELMYYGENLDLTGAVLSVYTKDGQTKEVPFNNLDDYGITTSIANGTMITESTPGLTFGKLQILFQQEAGLISMPTNVVAQKKTSKNLPSHLIIEFADGKPQRVELDDKQFNYEVAAVGDITAIKMFDDDRELAEATYYEEYGDWEFDLSAVEPGEGYTGWKYENYYITIDSSADTSAVASFTLDTNYLETTYGAGYDLDLSSLGISLKTEKGSVQRIDGWDDCAARGFTAVPENGYTFTKEDAKAGTKTIQIKNGDLTQSFEVDVIDYEKQIPAKIILSNQEGTEIKTVTIELAEWKEERGMLSLYNVKMPEEYKDWNTDTIKVAIYNSDNELLNDYSVSPYLSGKAMEINFPNYTEYDSYGGYVRLMFDFSDEVVDYASQVPAKVELYDADTNDLIQTIQVDAEKWQTDKGCVMLMGIELPDTYKGWTPDTFTVKIYNAKDEVVEDSLYTTGYDDYEEALEIDFPHYKEYDSEGGYLKLCFTFQPSVEPDPNVTAEGVATVKNFGYDAKVRVTYNKETGVIVSVVDNGTEHGGGYNQTCWEKAVALFEKFQGKTAAEIDDIDAVASATLSSNAIKEAVKNALPAATETVDAPTVKAQDLRTQMLFAATEPAVLQVSTPEGTEVYYTIDGSDPTTSESKQKMTDQTVSIKAASNEDSQMMVKLAANKNGTWSAVTEIPVSFVKIPESDTGTKVYLGQATCPGAEGQPYDVKVKVTTVNGQIALLEDNGTEPSGESDYAFWLGWDVMGSEGMPSKLKGKNLQQLLNARTTPSDDETVKVDAISGATLSSDAVKYATIAALRSQPIEEGQGEIAPPILQSEKLVAPNTSAGSISVVMTGTTGEEIHYTLDGSEPTIDSPAASDIPYTDDKGVVLKADKDTYPDGRVVVVKAAAFQDGKKSDTVTARYVFANANAEHSYEMGTFQGSSDDVQVTVEIESPNFDQKYYITDIRLDDASQQAYRAFLPELLNQVYLKQGVDGVTAISGYETESQKVLSAIENALDQTFVAAQPVISVEPDASQYANDAQVTVSLSCPTQGAQIYYVVETSDDVSGTLSDFETNKMLYTDSFTVGIDNPDGGKVYLRAAAQTANGKLSEITRKDLDFVKGVNENAFTVDNQNYDTWAEAVAAVEKAGSGEIVLNDDVELLDSDTLPAVSCTIRSNDTQKYTITGSVLNAKADVTFDNVAYDINSIYANGHSVEIGADVETPFSFWNRSIYAGPSYDAEEKEITADPVITIESGTFALYGSGGGTTTVNGDVEIHIKGTASAEVGGAYMNAIVNGTVSVFVKGTATLEEFLGEQKDGQLEDIKLTIEGSPSLTGDTYIGSVNGTPKGTLDLQNATLTEEQIAKFVGFEEILQAEANEILEAEVLTEILAPTQPAEDVLAKEPVTEEMSEAAVELPVEEKDKMPEIITALPAEQKEEVPEATVEILEAEDFESVEDLSKEEESILFVESEHLTE